MKTTPEGGHSSHGKSITGSRADTTRAAACARTTGPCDQQSAPEDRASIFVATGKTCGNGPGQRDRRTQQDGAQNAGEPAFPGESRVPPGASTAAGSVCNRITGPLCRTPRPIATPSMTMPGRARPSASDRMPCMPSSVKKASITSNIAEVEKKIHSRQLAELSRRARRDRPRPATDAWRVRESGTGQRPKRVAKQDAATIR